LIPYDFVNQVIPVIFKVTVGGTDALRDISTQIEKIPSGVTTKVRLEGRNTGDVPIWHAIVNVVPGIQSALGINGLTPSAITSPNIPQTLSLYNSTDRNSGSIGLLSS
jgi:hypothetical protein